MPLFVFSFLIGILVSNSRVTYAVYYDSYTGSPISSAEIKQHIKHNTTYWCVKEIQPCDPHEWRRIDGSCNNLKNPSIGSAHTPTYRILPANFGKDFSLRTGEDGQNLPPCRPLRTYLVPNGYLPDQKFTHLLTNALVFFSADITSLHDTVNYILWKPYCCKEKGKSDPACVPMNVPDDDPVHRFSNIRCLNLTKPETFQSKGCLFKDTTPERIISNTPLLDLSIIYGTSLSVLIKKGRMLKGGLLKYEVENGKIWPPSTKTPVDLCLLNQKPYETRCHDTPDDGTNTLLGINLFSIWTWRFHNQIATKLSNINPCWDDEKLFYTAREIVIAVFLQIFYYEMWPVLLGRKNLIRDSVISSSTGFRDLYNENIMPQLSLEFPVVLRWIHTIQEGNIRMYDTEGYHLRDMKIVNLTLRTGYLVENIDYIAQSAIRQPCGKIDHAVDWDIAEVGLGPHQRASDLLASDVCKNRHFGLPPFVAYKEFCTSKSYDSFEDLKDSISPEGLELLKQKYRHVRDIDLSAGLWLENFIEGGHVPQTFYCLVVENLIHNMVSDRHWYERSDRPNAFNYDQLQSIRKMTIARFMCDTGDSITRIQPNPFFRAGPGNEICSCNLIEELDLRPWKDNTRNCNKQYGGSYYIKQSN